MSEAEAENAGNSEKLIQELLDTALLHQQGGDLEQAEDYYRDVLKRDPGRAAAHHGLGRIALQVEANEIAEQLIGTAVELEPDNPNYQCDLATAKYAQERLEEAEAGYRRALELDPEYGEAQLNLGLTLKVLQRNEEAREALDRAVNLRPRDPKGFASLAEVLFECGQAEDAKEIVRAAVNLGPADTTARLTAARVLRCLGLNREAAGVARALVRDYPNDARYRLNLAQDYQAMGFPKPSNEEARRAMRLDPSNPQAYQVAAGTEWIVGEPEEAQRLMDKALELAPDNPRFIGQKANLLERQGYYEEAYRLVRPEILNRTTYPPQLFSVFLTLTRRFGAQEEALGMLENALGNTSLPNGVWVDLNFQAGNLYHELGRYDEAFAAFQEGNRFKPRDYYPEREEEHFRRIRETFTRDFFASAPRSGDDTEVPVFIVGMPRSGTSLTEQIIASHPRAYGAGELGEIDRQSNELRNWHDRRPFFEIIPEISQEELARMAQGYLDYIQELAPEGVERITDKMPQNFVSLGIIALMFPNARIIHTNRDPLDTCLSNYMQNFAAAGLSFSYDLENLGHYYRLYQGIMEHWRQVLPLPIYELQYEDLVADPEGEIPRLLEFVDLPFDEACLEPHKAKRQTKTASYDQVRQPIYRKSAEKWRKYEKHLGPLMEALGMDPAEMVES